MITLFKIKTDAGKKTLTGYSELPNVVYEGGK